MLRRYQPLIAALAIVLQAIDAIVGGLGHSHHHEPAAATAAAETHVHGSGCSHHHHAHSLPSKQDADDSPVNHSPSRDHDDCSLCRHSSQPIAPIAVAIELVGSQRVEIFVPATVEHIIALAPPAHPARGPPALSV